MQPVRLFLSIRTSSLFAQFLCPHASASSEDHPSQNALCPFSIPRLPHIFFLSLSGLSHPPPAKHPSKSVQTLPLFPLCIHTGLSSCTNNTLTKMYYSKVHTPLVCELIEDKNPSNIFLLTMLSNCLEELVLNGFGIK